MSDTPSSATISAPPAGVANTELMRWVIDRINARDLDALRQIWTPDTREYFPDATCHGTEEIAAYFGERFAAFSDFHLDIVAMAESGEDLFLHWRMTGRHTGPALGVAATGKPVRQDGMDHFVLRDGKVVMVTVVFDQAALARQIGMLPPAGSRTERALKTAFNALTKVRTTVRS